MLALKKPIVFFDLETTGLSITQDKIVEISLLKINIDNSQEIKTIKVNPEIPIPPKIQKLIGITDEEVKDLAPFKLIAHEVHNFMKGADLAGYNLLKFDIPFLVEEFLRSGIEYDIKKVKVIDVQRIFHLMEQRNLSAAYEFYCGKKLENAHTAEADTIATYEVFLGQLTRYESLENDVDKVIGIIGDYSKKMVDFAGRLVLNDDNNPIFNFGKYKGIEVTKVFADDPSYYAWMMKGDFPEYTKKKITEIKLSMMQL